MFELKMKDFGMERLEKKRKRKGKFGKIGLGEGVALIGRLVKRGGVKGFLRINWRAGEVVGLDEEI